ncbi:uncharacterized protein G6M90_00g066470 [Metarhizium brunneum]|uniref:Uncharacterized protein n=1 Tax=Metarhizium brunneum TaxID=500148 RepID=A0A7D5Z5T3_9HYPO|nr:hypothetical protein G6M90_00g066470 [Metarhizium brunneum]
MLEIFVDRNQATNSTAKAYGNAHVEQLIGELIPYRQYAGMSNG